MKKQFEMVCGDSLVVEVRSLLDRFFQIRASLSPRLRTFLEELDSLKLGDNSHEYLTLVIDKWSFKNGKLGG